MATLRTKINRFYKNNSKFISICIIDTKGNEMDFDLYKQLIPTVKSYSFGKPCVECGGFSNLEMFFPGLLEKEVLDTRQSVSTYMYVDYDFTESLKKVFKYNIFRYLKDMSSEQREIANSLRTLIDANPRQFEAAFKELKGCDESDIKALTSVVYCLKNNIKATKGTYAYGAKLVWEALGQKAIHINKNSTYCFCLYL